MYESEAAAALESLRSTAGALRLYIQDGVKLPVVHVHNLTVSSITSHRDCDQTNAENERKATILTEIFYRISQHARHRHPAFHDARRTNTHLRFKIGPYVQKHPNISWDAFSEMRYPNSSPGNPNVVIRPIERLAAMAEAAIAILRINTEHRDLSTSCRQFLSIIADRLPTVVHVFESPLLMNNRITIELSDDDLHGKVTIDDRKRSTITFNRNDAFRRYFCEEEWPELWDFITTVAADGQWILTSPRYRPPSSAVPIWSQTIPSFLEAAASMAEMIVKDHELQEDYMRTSADLFGVAHTPTNVPIEEELAASETEASLLDEVSHHWDQLGTFTPSLGVKPRPATQEPSEDSTKGESHTEKPAFRAPHCPACKSGRTRVSGSGSRSGAGKRSCKCMDCEHTWSTKKSRSESAEVSSASSLAP